MTFRRRHVSHGCRVSRRSASGRSAGGAACSAGQQRLTFTAPSKLASPAAAPTGLTKPWMDFGNDGTLGVMWKTTDTDPFNV